MEDNVRKLFDRLSKKAVVVSAAAEGTLRKAGKKTGDTVEVAKLNMKIFDLHSEIGFLQKKLGELVYQTHKGKNASDEEIESLIADIDAKHHEIDQYRERIGILKGTVICPVFQGACGKDDRFCKKCGTEL